MPSLIDRLFPPSQPASHAVQGDEPPAAGPAVANGGPVSLPASNRDEPVTAVQLPGEAEPGVQVTTAPPDAAAGTCASCGAPLAVEQEWCLECGAEVVRQESGTWRMGLAVAGSLLVLAAIGFGIAYVALSDRSARDAALAGPPSRLSNPSPVSATPPAATTPGGSVTGPGGPLPSPAPAHTPVTPAPGAAPSSAGVSAAPSTAAGVPTPASTSKPGAPAKTTQPSATDPSNLVKPTNPGVRPISFDPGTAHSFPSAGSGTNPSYAVDGDPSTAWRTSTPGSGLYVDAGTPTPVRSVTVTTDSPGFTAEIYGAASGPPGSLSSWTQLAGPSTVSRKQTFSVSRSAQYRYFLVYVTQLGGSHADVNELEVLP